MKKYHIIYADPPWKQNKGGLRKCRPNQSKKLDYPTLELQEIRKIIDSVPKEDNHTLFLWTIDKYLIEAENLFSDYRRHARLIWDKGNGIAPSFSIRYTHEYLLWLYKGVFLLPERGYRGKYKTCFFSPSTGHSIKPICVYEMIESFYPLWNKIELFARNKRITNPINGIGWDVWGNEVESDIDLLGA